jgi:hypothetical protein
VLVDGLYDETLTREVLALHDRGDGRDRNLSAAEIKIEFERIPVAQGHTGPRNYVSDAQNNIFGVVHLKAVR